MKKKFNIFICLSMLLLVVSCSTSKYASAQQPDQYNNSNSDPNYQDNNSYQDNNQNNNSQDNNAYNNQDQSNDNYNNGNNYSDNNQNNDNQNYDNGQDNTNGQNYQNGNDQNYDDNEGNVTIDDFNQTLSPYGNWVQDPTYGRVWVCNVPNFRPYYSGGHWVYTSWGWTWVSDYAWGWAPFHYGRWAYASYGWAWVPGYQWGPAWVGWRTGGNYYGWAPLAPGIGIGFGVGFRGYGYIPSERWCFIPHNYIGSPYWGRYSVNSFRNESIIRNTTIINNTNIYNRRAIVAGPARAEVERFTGRPVQAMSVVNASRPGASFVRNNSVSIYRPQHINNVVNRSNTTINNIHQNSFQQNANVQRTQPFAQQHNMNNLAERNNNYSNIQQQRANTNVNNNFQRSQPVQQQRSSGNVFGNQQRSFAQQNVQSQRNFAQQRNFTQQQRVQPQQRSFAAPQAQHSFAQAGGGYSGRSFSRSSSGGGRSGGGRGGRR